MLNNKYDGVKITWVLVIPGNLHIFLYQVNKQWCKKHKIRYFVILKKDTEIKWQRRVENIKNG